jgi:hypothetical protein
MPQGEAHIKGRTAAAFELRQLNVHSSRVVFKVKVRRPQPANRYREAKRQHRSAALI